MALGPHVARTVVDIIGSIARLIVASVRFVTGRRG